MRSKNLKRVIALCGAFYITAALVPLLAFCPAQGATSEEKNTPAAPISSNGVFRLKDADGSILEVEETEFVIGGIAAEVPPTYPPEALKAQGVALYTYYSRLREQSRAKDAECDFTCNTETGLVYLPKEARKERWGDSYEEWESALEEAEKAIRGQTLQEDGALLCSTYFAISSGSTDDAADVWGGDYSYLKPAASPGDVFADGYLSQASFSLSDASKAITDAYPDAKPGDDTSQWITNVERTGSGTIRKADLCGEEVTGTQLRNVFGLRSANFTWEEKDGKLVFTVKGWGHNVGMSQNGARYMAENGAGYEEILSWYYPGSNLIID